MKKEKIIFFIILGLFIAALILTGKVWISILIAMMLFYLVLALILVFAGGRKLSFRLNAEDEKEKGENAEVRFEAANHSLMPVFRCDLSLEEKNLLTGFSVLDEIRFGLFSRRTKEIELEAGDSVCGVLRIVLKEGRIMDPIGLFSRRLKDLAPEAEILVLPDMEKENVKIEELEHYDMESFRYADGKVGTDSSETVGIREYVEGDSVRAIHWKLSAKTGETVVKEYGFPVDTRILLIADKRVAKEDGAKKMGELTEFVLSAARSLAEREVSFSLGWYNADKKQFFLSDIDNRDGLYLLLPEFLRAPFSMEDADPALHFLESDEEKRYSSYIYLTDEPGKEDRGLEQLRDYGYVTILTPKKESENPD